MGEAEERQIAVAQICVGRPPAARESHDHQEPVRSMDGGEQQSREERAMQTVQKKSVQQVLLKQPPDAGKNHAADSERPTDSTKTVEYRTRRHKRRRHQQEPWAELARALAETGCAKSEFTRRLPLPDMRPEHDPVESNPRRRDAKPQPPDVEEDQDKDRKSEHAAAGGAGRSE